MTKASRRPKRLIDLSAAPDQRRIQRFRRDQHDAGGAFDGPLCVQSDETSAVPAMKRYLACIEKRFPRRLNWSLIRAFKRTDIDDRKSLRSIRGPRQNPRYQWKEHRFRLPAAVLAARDHVASVHHGGDRALLDVAQFGPALRPHPAFDGFGEAVELRRGRGGHNWSRLNSLSEMSNGMPGSIASAEAPRSSAISASPINERQSAFGFCSRIERKVDERLHAVSGGPEVAVSDAFAAMNGESVQRLVGGPEILSDRPRRIAPSAARTGPGVHPGWRF